MAAALTAVQALRRPYRLHYAAWAAALLLIASGMALLCARGTIPNALSIGLANILVFLGTGLVWGGLSVLEGRPVRWWAIALAPAIWFVACQIPWIYGDLGLRLVLGSFLSAGVAFAIARDLWRDGDPWTASRRQCAVLCIGHGVFLTGRGLYALVTPLPDDLLHPGAVISAMMFEPILVLFAAIVLCFGMVHERTETFLQRRASLDGLTGLLNRSAFMQAAAEAIEKARQATAPVALLVFDLDRFKQINDGFGHAAGDRVITTFAEVARQAIGAHPIGRIGGEEFAALLPGLGSEAARLAAERIRRDFMQRRIEHDGVTVAATVSIGVVAQAGTPARLDRLLDLADRALYSAKRAGRDRVRLAAAE